MNNIFLQALIIATVALASPASDGGAAKPPPAKRGPALTLPVLEHRSDFMERSALFFEELNKTNGPISDVRTYFATVVVNNEQDAAVLTFVANGESMALFFMYRNGAWTPIGEEFVR